MIPDETELLSERLRLRKITKSDIPFVFSASRYPGFCDGMHWEPPTEEGELIAPFENNLKAWKEGSGYTFTIEWRDSGEPLGRICIRKQEGEVWDFGFWTHPEHYGQGIMTEAVGRLMGFGFGELQASEIQASHATWNLASRRVLEKSGFRFLKRQRDAMEKHGECVDEDLLVISRVDWESGK